jgi:microcystin degradation protein MlrC
MKIIAALFQHETNTFSSLPTPYEAFAGSTGLTVPPSGDEAVEIYGQADMAFAGFLEVGQKADAEIVIPIAAYAEPSGPVSDQAFERVADRICEAVTGGCDAVMLDLHGAMVTESFNDGEGELLRRIRRIAPDTPVAVALDFHANLTSEMVTHATVITGYCTYPHVDMRETGLRAGRILLRTLKGETCPRMLWGSVPVLSHMLKQTPARQPMQDIMDLALAAERSGRVHTASVFGGFPLADIPHVGLSAVITAEKDEGGAEELIRRILETAWERRADFVFNTEPVDRSVARAKALPDGPVILVDEGDNCGAGGGVDDMTVIAEVLRQGLTNVAAGPIWDPEALAAMAEAGIGAGVTLPVGGKTDSPSIGRKGEPLVLSGTVRNITDGRFRIEGPMMTGLEIDLKGSAVLDTGAMELVVSGERCEPFDLTFLSHARVDPRSKNYVVLKSRQHFRAGFEPIARHIIIVSGPGVCSSDYGQFPFRNLPRPIYPLDPDMTWSYKGS